MSLIINNVQGHSALVVNLLQPYSAPEAEEIEMSLENTILKSSGEDWEEYED